MQGKDAILGLLSEHDHTGYELKRLIETRLKFFFDGTIGMIYPTLKRLEADKLVTKKVVIQSDKPNKNIYSITAAGRAVLDEYLHSEVAADSIKLDFVMRLNFGKTLSPEQIRALVENELARKRADWELLKSGLPKWEATGITEAQYLAYQYGEAYYQSVIQLLENYLDKKDSNF